MYKNLSHKPKAKPINYKDVLSLNHDLMEAFSIQAPVLPSQGPYSVLVHPPHYYSCVIPC